MKKKTDSYNNNGHKAFVPSVADDEITLIVLFFCPGIIVFGKKNRSETHAHIHIYVNVYIHLYLFIYYVLHMRVYIFYI